MTSWVASWLALAAVSACTCLADAGAWDVELADLKGMEHGPNGALSKLTSSGDPAWDASAASAAAEMQAPGVAFEPVEGAVFACGLASSASARRKAAIAEDQSYKSIDFAAYFVKDGRLGVMELGSFRGWFGRFGSGDRAEVAVNAQGQVEYRVNSEVRYVSQVRPAYPLHAKVASFNHGPVLRGLQWTEIGLSWSSVLPAAILVVAFAAVSLRKGSTAEKPRHTARAAGELMGLDSEVVEAVRFETPSRAARATGQSMDPDHEADEATRKFEDFMEKAATYVGDGSSKEVLWEIWVVADCNLHRAINHLLDYQERQLKVTTGTWRCPSCRAELPSMESAIRHCSRATPARYAVTPVFSTPTSTSAVTRRVVCPPVLASSAASF